MIGGGGLYGKPSAPIPYSMIPECTSAHERNSACQPKGWRTSPIPECKDKKRYRKKRKMNINKC